MTAAERQRNRRARLKAEAAKRVPRPTTTVVKKLMKRIARLEREIMRLKGDGRRERETVTT
jgi:hypothetical protein